MSHKHDGYAQIPNWFFSLNFTLKARCVYAALCLHDYGSHKVFPSEATLVEASGVSRSKVYVALRELEEAGVITVEHRHAKSGLRQSNLYTLHQLREQDVEGLRLTLTRKPTAKRKVKRGDYVSRRDIGSPRPAAGHSDIAEQDAYIPERDIDSRTEGHSHVPEREMAMSPSGVRRKQISPTGEETNPSGEETTGNVPSPAPPGGDAALPLAHPGGVPGNQPTNTASMTDFKAIRDRLERHKTGRSVASPGCTREAPAPPPIAPSGER